MEHGFSWVQQIPGLNLLEPHTATALIVMVGLLIFALRARQQLAGAGNQVVPDEGFSARNIGEVVTEFITNLSESVIGHDGPKYVPLFGSLFVFILGSNLMGLIPGFTPPTASCMCRSTWISWTPASPPRSAPPCPVARPSARPISSWSCSATAASSPRSTSSS